MKKTVLLIRNAAPNDFGGAETYPVSLAKILHQKDWNAVIVTASKKLLAYAAENDIPTYKGKWFLKQNFTGKRNVLFPFYIIRQLYLTCWYIGVIKKTKADTLHIQSRDDFIAASIAGRILKKKVVWTDHMDLRYIFENINKPFRNLVGKMVFWATRFANTIILISNNEYKLVTAQFKNSSDLDSKIVIVKNGVVDLNNTLSKTPHASFIFTLASRLVKNKGVGEAIDAFGTLPSTVDAQLHIYGDGRDAEAFKQQANTNTAITFFGHTDNSLQAIKDSDVFILPSYQEGFSIALLEATMLESTIIASDVDSNSEIIINESTGLLIPARDPEALKNAMQRLYEDKALREKLAHTARKKYEQEFNLVSIVENEILPLY